MAIVHLSILIWMIVPINYLQELTDVKVIFKGLMKKVTSNTGSSLCILWLFLHNTSSVFIYGFINSCNCRFMINSLCLIFWALYFSFTFTRTISHRMRRFLFHLWVSYFQSLPSMWFSHRWRSLFARNLLSLDSHRVFDSSLPHFLVLNFGCEILGSFTMAWYLRDLTASYGRYLAKCKLLLRK